MRPAGEDSQKLLQSVQQLATPGRAPILKELAAHTQVGEAVASQTLKNLTRDGRLRIVRTRRVDWRARPVAEYALPVAAANVVAANDADGGFAVLAFAWR